MEDINALFDATIKMLDCDDIWCIGYGNIADYIGGANGMVKNQIRFGCNCTFFCKVGKEIEFISRFAEDVVTSGAYNNIGRLMISYLGVEVRSYAVGKNTGGMAEIYADGNSYKNAFYSVMWMPSAVSLMPKKQGFTMRRNYDKCVPKILNQRWRKWTK